MRRWFIVGMAWLLAPVAAAAPDTPDEACEAVLSAAEVRVTIEQADQAFLDADADAFRLADDSVTEQVVCLSSAVTPDLAAAIHRTSGVRAFLDRDIERAEIRFAASRRLMPTYSWPESLIPAMHPLRDAYSERDIERVTDQPLPAPRRGVVAFDGHLGAGRPMGLPTLFQIIRQDGTAAQSVVLQPFDDTPEYQTGGGFRVRPTTVVAIGAAVLAGAFYAGAADQRRRYDDLDTPYEDLDGIRSRVVGLTISSAALGGLALGSGVAAIVPQNR